MNLKPRFAIYLIFSMAIGLLLLWQDTADAARFGGGRSFGSRPGYQRSVPAPPRTPAAPATAPRQSAQPLPGGTPAQAPFGPRGGMLGGLLMGGLIGSLLFGGGHGAGGPGLLDLLLIGGGLFLLLRFLRTRQSGVQSRYASGPVQFERRPADGWGGTGLSPASEGAAGSQAQPTYPPWFDAAEFIKGAVSIYTRLQAAWDQRQLDDIRQFTSPEVYREIEAQAEEDPTPGKTELLLVNPQILEVRSLGDQTIATVLYDVMLREDDDTTAKQVRELWHFSRQTQNPQSFWMLEGIQQIEN